MLRKHLNPKAKKENIRTLCAALGLNETQADELLDFKVTLTCNDHPNDRPLALEISKLLGRTIENIHINYRNINSSIEVTTSLSDWHDQSLNLCHINISSNKLRISNENTSSYEIKKYPSHGLFVTLSACYASAYILKRAIPLLPYAVPNPLYLDLEKIIDPTLLAQPLNLGKTYLAGAGAIGNGLLWAFQHLDINGQLHICDDDSVSHGNINRQIWFVNDDIGKEKTICLSDKAQKYIPNLKLIPQVSLLQELPESNIERGFPRLISAVDSRRARRKLQDNFPGEVFDASTTDITEIIIHHNKQPTEKACLSCIYHENTAELLHEAHIADNLGVPIQEVTSGRISLECANIIASRFQAQGVKAPLILGEAYDSFYKTLCGQGKLISPKHKQILAPFCFVSILAGIMLAIKIIQELSGREKKYYNYWRISPWNPPIQRLQREKPRLDNCSFCGEKIYREMNNRQWGI